MAYIVRTVMAELNVQKTLTGKRILFTGATGFVGKVALSMLLHRYGKELSRVYVLVRRGSSVSAGHRFFDKVAPSEPFQPLRDLHGDAGAQAFLKEKCVVLDGDVADPFMGLPLKDVEALKGQVDICINCAGLVSFNPSLEVALNVNTYGVKNMVELCLAWGIPLVHVSTSFVAGNRSGLVFEDEEIGGYFPKKGTLDGRDFSLENELKDCERQVAQLRERADDKTLTSLFRTHALDRLAEEGRDRNDEKTLRLAVARERKLWLTQELIQVGMERARHWGWPNTYTYTKSLGEQVLAQTAGLRYAIVRPSIVESALRYPFPGWNEGFTTSAPLALAGLRGQRQLPAGERTILDIIPVDLVAGSLIAITAHALTTPERRAYHQASGDMNPFYASRSVELVGLHRRRHFRDKTTGNKLWNSLLSRIEPQPVSKQVFQSRSTPLFARGAKLLKQALEDIGPTWGAPNVSALVERAKDKLAEVEEQATSFTGLVDLFLPFTWENRYVFRCDNTRSVYAQMRPEDAALIPWDPETLDWRDYFLNVHLPGLEKWVLPNLEELTERKRTIHAYRDLLELFDASVHAFRHRVAFRRVADEKEERFTYGEVARYVTRVAAFLQRSGMKPGAKVLLISENRPEWPISYFGILRVGGTVVPVDPQVSEAEVVNIARRSEAAAVLISEEAAGNLPNLFDALAQAKLCVPVYTLALAMGGEAGSPDAAGPAKRSAAPDDVASLIFTSGTTGVPKGVMLTHRNFASLVPKLARAFEIGVGDGLLSVLPLHHTFEFACGLLTPFSRGAEVTYIDELTADRLGDVFETGRITAMIGVPAVWQLLHKKMTQELAAKPPVVEQAIKALLATHGELRNRSSLNLGKLLFWPVHRKFGGRMKFLVSGGSALPDDVHKAFHALGFNISEGYGLTEASPVLAVAPVSNKRLPGTVGKPLPGVEIKINAPDADGIGEVWAKGPNIMAGYYGDRESTEAVLKDGWLRTGDLGRLDEEGKLYLVGRQKDVIIDANGKNVYPDELEELYEVHPHIKELSIVGMPEDDGGERVACLCVPELKGRPAPDVRRELDEHFRKVSADLPFYRRVKVIRFVESELPRTSTRKVKRKEVVERLQALERAAAAGEKARAPAVAAGGRDEWLIQLIAGVLQRPVSDITLASDLTADLGFDSLMLSELSVALEQAGLPVPAIKDLTQIQTVKDLGRVIAVSGRRPASEAHVREAPKQDEADVELSVPAPVASVGRALLALSQRLLYGGVFQLDVQGKSFIPSNRNFIVVANHTSHLDMGLVKVVLGEQGDKLTALAARDYFFDTPLKRAYFENFTNLIPMDRDGSLRESLKLAGEALRQGFHLLIFPEGTRSPTGELLEFKATLGYLAMTYHVDVLPLYLDGTHAALPKGALFPKHTQLKVRIGPALEYAQLKKLAQGFPRSEGYRRVTRVVEEAVRRLKVGEVLALGDDAAKDAAASPPLKTRGAKP